jgi:hypothetical protein
VIEQIEIAEVLGWLSSDAGERMHGDYDDAILADDHEHERGWCRDWSEWLLEEKRYDLDDWPSGFVDDIERNGIRVPLAFYQFPNLSRPMLVDGHHRLVVAVDLGWKTVPVRPADGDPLLLPRLTTIDRITRLSPQQSQLVFSVGATREVLA